MDLDNDQQQLQQLHRQQQQQHKHKAMLQQEQHQQQEQEAERRIAEQEIAQEDLFLQEEEEERRRTIEYCRQPEIDAWFSICKGESRGLLNEGLEDDHSFVNIIRSLVSVPTEGEVRILDSPIPTVEATNSCYCSYPQLWLLPTVIVFDPVQCNVGHLCPGEPCSPESSVHPGCVIDTQSFEWCEPIRVHFLNCSAFLLSRRYRCTCHGWFSVSNFEVLLKLPSLECMQSALLSLPFQRFCIDDIPIGNDLLNLLLLRLRGGQGTFPLHEISLHCTNLRNERYQQRFEAYKTTLEYHQLPYEDHFPKVNDLICFEVSPSTYYLRKRFIDFMKQHQLFFRKSMTNLTAPDGQLFVDVLPVSTLRDLKGWLFLFNKQGQVISHQAIYTDSLDLLPIVEVIRQRLSRLNSQPVTTLFMEKEIDNVTSFRTAFGDKIKVKLDFNNFFWRVSRAIPDSIARDLAFSEFRDALFPESESALESRANATEERLRNLDFWKNKWYSTWPEQNILWKKVEYLEQMTSDDCLGEQESLPSAVYEQLMEDIHLSLARAALGDEWLDAHIKLLLHAHNYQISCIDDSYIDDSEKDRKNEKNVMFNMLESPKHELESPAEDVDLFEEFGIQNQSQDPEQARSTAFLLHEMQLLSRIFALLLQYDFQHPQVPMPSIVDLLNIFYETCTTSIPQDKYMSSLHSMLENHKLQLQEYDRSECPPGIHSLVASICNLDSSVQLSSLAPIPAPLTNDFGQLCKYASQLAYVSSHAAFIFLFPGKRLGPMVVVREVPDEILNSQIGYPTNDTISMFAMGLNCIFPVACLQLPQTAPAIAPLSQYFSLEERALLALLSLQKPGDIRHIINAWESVARQSVAVQTKAKPVLAGKVKAITETVMFAVKEALKELHFVHISGDSTTNIIVGTKQQSASSKLLEDHKLSRKKMKTKSTSQQELRDRLHLQHCSHCDQIGHNKRTCTMKGAQPVAPASRKRSTIVPVHDSLSISPQLKRAKQDPELSIQPLTPIPLGTSLRDSPSLSSSSSPPLSSSSESESDDHKRTPPNRHKQYRNIQKTEIKD